MTYLHVTLGAHLELRVEVVVSISQPRVSSTSACEIDQANEARSRNSRRYGAQLTVGACRQTRKQDMVFPSLSVPSAGARRNWTRSSSLLRRQPVWLGGGNGGTSSTPTRGHGGTSWAPTRGARTTTAPWLMAGELVPVVSRHRRPQGGQGKAQLEGPVAGDGLAAARRKWAWLSFHCHYRRSIREGCRD